MSKCVWSFRILQRKRQWPVTMLPAHFCVHDTNTNVTAEPKGTFINLLPFPPRPERVEPLAGEYPAVLSPDRLWNSTHVQTVSVWAVVSCSVRHTAMKCHVPRTGQNFFLFFRFLLVLQLYLTFLPFCIPFLKLEVLQRITASHCGLSWTYLVFVLCGNSRVLTRSVLRICWLWSLCLYKDAVTALRNLDLKVICGINYHLSSGLIIQLP